MQSGDRRMDVSAVYWIVLHEKRLSELETILRGFKSKTTQEAIYLEVEHDVDIRRL